MLSLHGKNRATVVMYFNRFITFQICCEMKQSINLCLLEQLGQRL